MNIFILSLIISECAKFHCDKHVVKLLLESAQLLCTAHRVLDGVFGRLLKNNKFYKVYLLPDNREEILYKATHINHPCAIWVRNSKQNYEWLYELFVELCKEYTFRYGKVHLCETKLMEILKTPPKTIPDIGLTPFAQAMPEIYKDEDAVIAYRNYYLNAKKHILKYTKREVPEFIANGLN